MECKEKFKNENYIENRAIGTNQPEIKENNYNY
jgi:hypothetical protein